MPKLSTRQEGCLYAAFMSYLLATTTPSAVERKFHMQMCNRALADAGLPLMADLLRSFDSLTNLNVGGLNDNLDLLDQVSKSRKGKG